MKRRNKATLNMTVWFTIFLFLEYLFAVAFATMSVTLFNKFSPSWISMPSEIMVFIFSLAIGIACSFLANRMFFNPLRKISRNMQLVAKGDFSIRMNDRSRFQEVDLLYKNFNLMTKELGGLEILQSDFMANVSHEFKTPISAIEGYSMLLQGCDNKAEQEEYIKKILFNTKRLSNLVGNILLLSKLDNQVIQVKFKNVNLAEQIRQAILLQEIKWVEKDIELDVEMEEIEHFATEEFLLHVWSNLLSNAIKFSTVGGKIIIRLHGDAKSIKFEITDSGSGVPENIKKHIFNKFYQGESEHKDEGNGLGLALVKRIVDLNKGVITVENTKDMGAKFTVWFPRREQTTKN
ncbi:MAG: HAMP domain-containing histidine kinase [Clostridia bacterium]|nr:HAMP domain-containing histidine kinase [Clostridia bacterium]